MTKKKSFEQRAIEWLLKGNTGVSSKAMLSVAMGVNAYKDHPHDPSDFYRCLILVKKMPEIREHFNQIAKTNDGWRIVIDNWDLIKKTLIQEVGMPWKRDQSATKTYQLMKNLLEKKNDH